MAQPVDTTPTTSTTPTALSSQIAFNALPDPSTTPTNTRIEEQGGSSLPPTFRALKYREIFETPAMRHFEQEFTGDDYPTNLHTLKRLMSIEDDEEYRKALKTAWPDFQDDIADCGEDPEWSHGASEETRLRVLVFAGNTLACKTVEARQAALGMGTSYPKDTELRDTRTQSDDDDRQIEVDTDTMVWETASPQRDERTNEMNDDDYNPKYYSKVEDKGEVPELGEPVSWDRITQRLAH